MFQFLNADQHFESGNEIILQSPHATLPGRPVISNYKVDQFSLKGVCPVNAIGVNPTRIDLTRCTFCGRCEKALPEKIKFTNDYRVASNVYDRLTIIEGENESIKLDHKQIRKELQSLTSKHLSLKLIHSCVDENEVSWLQSFNLSYLGIHFVQSASDAQGLVLVGDINEDMLQNLGEVYNTVQNPRIMIVAGSQALRSKVFINSAKIQNRYPVDLFIPGNPFHPLTFATSVRQLFNTKN